MNPLDPYSQKPWLKAWAVFFLISWAGGLIAGAVASGPLHFILSLAKVTETSRHNAISVLGFIVSLPVSYGVYVWSVRRYLLPQSGAVETKAGGGSNPGH